MTSLPTPPAPSEGASTDDVVAWVSTHLGDLAREGADGVRPGVVRGGQAAADTVLAGLDVAGYARTRSTVLPEERRGATRVSPYVRHGLIQLPELWDAVADAPARDRGKYRDELLWQEYARHLYARVGSRLAWSLRREQPRPDPWPEPLRTDMACGAFLVDSLTEDGWLVNQTRMWLASQWTVRGGGEWRAGEDAMFAHLLDGSRAANRLGWQWTIGTGSGKPYGFSRWQVEKRAPELCRGCVLKDACPVQGWPDAEPGPQVADAPDLGKGPVPGGPENLQGDGGELVWLTAESLGTADPALAADPDRPAVFVFDEALLRRLRLSGKRLVFLAECLGDLAAERELEVRRGDVVEQVAEHADGRALATTYAPVPGWGPRAERLDPAEVHPWPWLVQPRPAAVRSFSAWRKTSGR
ncbi:FAD-binding domain-containing protein [Nocardioides nanhaiensis]|uniref:Cryptochrome/DNA photolyase FAD-binding domain-containing protein n=1 Tax=Nocardioides nanhaiensis TaxID=1476871 RepID=A0ABP8W685_9ACTN